MKQFFEQYGSVALGILALLVLIAMITPVGNIIKTSLQGTTETFSTKMESQTDTMTAQMQETFKSASTEIHYDENGILLNGIIDRTLYVNGVAYQNKWDFSQNDFGTRTVLGWTKYATPTGYHFQKDWDEGYNQPYVNEITYSLPEYNFEYRAHLKQKYNFSGDTKYIIYSSNPAVNALIYNYFGSNDIALGPVTWRADDGVEGKQYAIGSNIGIIERKFDASYFTLRIGTSGNHSTNVGTVIETDFMVFEVPSDLDIDLSSL